MAITLHAIGELSQLQRSACCSSANADGSAVTTSKASSNLLSDNTYRCVCAGNCVIHPDK